MTSMYSLFGLVVGVLFLMVALFCMIRQLAGETKFEVAVWGLKLSIKTAVPGLVFGVLGLAVIFVTRT